MSRTVKDVDEQVLEQASELLGTETPKDTVNAALREVVRRRMVQEYVTYLQGREAEQLERDRDEAWR